MVQLTNRNQWTVESLYLYQSVYSLFLYTIRQDNQNINTGRKLSSS